MGWNYALTSVTFESGSALKNLGTNTFFRAESLTNVILPSSIETIGDDAFYNCLKLSELRFEDQAQAEEGTDLSRLNSIGEDAFYHCGSLTGILKLGDGEDVPVGAFEGCGELLEISLPESCP